VPSSGRLERIDPRLCGGDRYAPRGHPRTWLWPAWELQTRIELAHVGVSRYEAKEVYRVRPTRMYRDDLLSGEIGRGRNGLEVHAVVTNRDDVLAGFRCARVGQRQLSGQSKQLLCNLVIRRAQRVVEYGEREVSRHDVADRGHPR